MSLFKISLTISWGSFLGLFFLSLVLFPLQLGYILDILSPSSFFDDGLIKVHEENHALVVVSGGWWMVCEWGVIITIDGIWLGTNHHGDAAETAVEWWWWWGWWWWLRWWWWWRWCMIGSVLPGLPSVLGKVSLTSRPTVGHSHKKSTTFKRWHKNRKQSKPKSCPQSHNKHWESQGSLGIPKGYQIFLQMPGQLNPQRFATPPPFAMPCKKCAFFTCMPPFSNTDHWHNILVQFL